MAGPVFASAIGNNRFLEGGNVGIRILSLSMGRFLVNHVRIFVAGCRNTLGGQLLVEGHVDEQKGRTIPPIHSDVSAGRQV